MLDTVTQVQGHVSHQNKVLRISPRLQLTFLLLKDLQAVGGAVKPVAAQDNSLLCL